MAKANDRHSRLLAKVKAYLAAEDAYFKGGKDRKDLKKKMAIGSELREMVYPKKQGTSQAIIDWLAS